MKVLIATTCLIAFTGTAALAQGVCKTEIEKAKTEWGALHLDTGGGKPSAIVRGIKGHEHIQAAVTSMRIHLVAATDLCAQGHDHESLLHLGVLRAFLQLPEIQHPTDHAVIYDPKAK